MQDLTTRQAAVGACYNSDRAPVYPTGIAITPDATRFLSQTISVTVCPRSRVSPPSTRCISDYKKNEEIAEKGATKQHKDD